MPTFGGSFGAGLDSAEDTEAYARQLRHLFPPGDLWNWEADSYLTKTTLGLAEELARVDARGLDIIAESDPRSAVETLDEWEEMLGLPDERVTEIPATTEERQLVVTQKYANRSGQNEAFFEKLCTDCGYTLTLIERFAASILRVDDRVDDRVYGEAFAYSMRLTVTAGATALSQTHFEAVVRHATHAHIQVMFIYS